MNAATAPFARLFSRRHPQLAKIRTIVVVAPFDPGDRSGMAKAIQDFVAMLARRHTVRTIAATQLPRAGAIHRMLGSLMTWALPTQRQCRPLVAGNSALEEAYEAGDAVIFEAFECALALYFRTPPCAWTILRDHEVLLRKLDMERRRARGFERTVQTLRLVSCCILSWVVYAKMDRIITLTEEDRLTIVRWFPSIAAKTTTVTAPFERPKEFLESDTPGGGRDLLMVGNFYHAPNLDALRWFLIECAPHLEPGFTLHLCGIDSPLDSLQLQGHGVEVRRHGFVADVSGAAPRAMIAVAPVVSGGGVRIKNLLLASLGKVIVTTTLGNEGIGFIDGRDAVITDDAKDMAAQLNRLARTPQELMRLSANARAFVEAHFNADTVYERFQREALFVGAQ